MSGGYEDDEDYGDVIVYTGHGGNDPGTKTQIADQELKGGNLALAVSSDRGLPVRVLRGAGGDPQHSPTSGYRYDGLYYVESYWPDQGVSGFRIWRFRLVKSPASNPVSNPPPADPPTSSGQKAYATTQRLVRNTAVTQWVKQLYDYRCQICGDRIETPTGPYAEGAHVRPVGRPHDGPDAAENVLCLCPNDHVRLDRGVIGLDERGRVLDLATGTAVGQVQFEQGHSFDFGHAAYHRSLHEPAAEELS